MSGMGASGQGAPKKMQLGKGKAASALVGFVAGAVVAAIVVVPWMVALGKMCPTVK